jgi:hypothetical protein
MRNIPTVGEANFWACRIEGSKRFAPVKWFG